MFYVPFIFLCQFAEGNDEIPLLHIYFSWGFLTLLYIFLIDKSKHELISEDLLYILVCFTATCCLNSTEYTYAFTLCTFLQCMARFAKNSVPMCFVMVLIYVLIIPFLPQKSIHYHAQILSICWAEYCHLAHLIICSII